ncbi:hypothetical protein [Enterococcus sp. AZ109]|uniref:hypothetical protein n=1 Tax=Enterococcus sp. AZ109 TaxID=2774634 RepID=UPI003F21AA22
MKYPCLVPKKLCTTPIFLSIAQEGISEDGEPLVAYEEELTCNYQDTAKTILTDEKKLVQLIGRAFFVGDIAPDIPVISSGEATVFGVKRSIVQGMKARNPDGTVNYTRLDLE